jgi:hypothetical protein
MKSEVPSAQAADLDPTKIELPKSWIPWEIQNIAVQVDVGHQALFPLLVCCCLYEEGDTAR